MNKKNFFILAVTLGIFFLSPTSSLALSETCSPAVDCDAGQNFYARACRPRIATLADCGTAPAGRYYSFSCTEGCFLRTTPTPNPCPGGMMVASECKTIVNVIKDGVGGLFKIWDGAILSRLVYLSDSDCTANQVAKWNGSRWACADDVGGGGGTNPWQTSGTNVSYNLGNVGVGIGRAWSTYPPVAPLDVNGAFRSGTRPTGESVGGNSTAMGNNTTASGYASTALGTFSSASNTGATALGSGVTASGSFSTAMGSTTTASGQASTAMGSGTTAAAPNSTAIGSNVNVISTATGSVGIGLNSTIAIPQVTTPNVMAILGGRVGIGTVTPSDLLQVNGNARATQFCLGATGNCISSWPSGGGSSSIWAESGGNVYRSSGNVGVGTTSPIAPLDVRGAARFGNPTETPVGSYSLAAGYNSEATAYYSTALGFATHALGERSVALGSLTSASGLASTSMGSFTHADGNYSTALGANITVSPTAINSVGIGLGGALSFLRQPNTMAILGGRVGIGTATPDRLLTVAGDGTSYMNLKDGIRELLMGADSNGGIISTITNHSLRLRTQNVDRLVITSNGTVGIGTASPAAALDVRGGIVLSNAISNNNVLLNQLDNGIFAINNGNSTRMVVEPDGDTKIVRLGIGPNDVNPVTSLDVDGPSVFRKRMSLGNNFAPFLDSNRGTAGIWMSARVNHPTFFYGIQSETAGAEKAGVYSGDAGWFMTFMNNGRVGIGTNNPDHTLAINTPANQNSFSVKVGNENVLSVNGLRDIHIGSTNSTSDLYLNGGQVFLGNGGRIRGHLLSTSNEYTAESINGDGSHTTDIIGFTGPNSICFLTRQLISETEGDSEIAECRVYRSGDAQQWVIEADTADSATARCSARCISWDGS